MGQKPSKLEVAESCLKPHQPHKCSDVDLRKLRALIKSGKLAPCYQPFEGEEWDSDRFEECPICFLVYPALNRSQCCCKEICTECFLQVKLPNGTRGGALCPFCKSEFSVYFKGPRTAEEREACRAEEQRVAEATSRAREAEEARSVERAIKRRMEKLEAKTKAVSGKQTQEESAGTVTHRASNEGCSRGPRRSGDIDEEALRAVLLSLDLSEYIPGSVVSSSADLEEALLQQAIQASLRESERHYPSELNVASPVQPDAVAFSPAARNSNLTVASPLTPSSSGVQAGSSATHTGAREPCRQEASTSAAFWEDVDLSSAPTGTPSIQRRPCSMDAHSSAEQPGATCLSLEAAGNSAMETALSTRLLTAPDASPSRALAEEQKAEPAGATQKTEAKPGHEAEAAAGRAGSRVSQGSSRHSQAQAHAPKPAAGFNALSTIDSSTMEQLLLTTRDFDGVLDTGLSYQDLLTTPLSPIMMSGGANGASFAPPGRRASLDISLRRGGEGQLAETPASSCRAQAALSPPATPESPSKAVTQRAEQHTGPDSSCGTSDSRLGSSATPAEKVECPDEGTARDASKAVSEDEGIGALEPATNAQHLGVADDEAAVEATSDEADKAERSSPSEAADSSEASSQHDESKDGQKLPAGGVEVSATEEIKLARTERGEAESTLAEAAAVSSSQAPAKPRRRKLQIGRPSEPSEPQQSSGDPTSSGSSHGSSAPSLEAILEHCPSVAHVGQQSKPQEAPKLHAGTEVQDTASADFKAQNSISDSTMPQFLRGLDLSHALIRRLSSGACSTDELIAALHSPGAAQPEPASPRSPLPGPPQHLKAFLSSEKRHASPLSARPRVSPAQEVPNPQQQPPSDPKPSSIQKGLSFADLVGAKARMSRSSSHSAKKTPHSASRGCFGAPATLTVGMVLTSPGSTKPDEAAPEGTLPEGKQCEKPGKAVEEAAIGNSTAVQGRLEDCSNAEPDLKEEEEGGGSVGARGTVPEGLQRAEKTELRDQGSRQQGCLIYEEPSTTGRMDLHEDGGAVFLTNPDGSTQLVLLTNDQKQQVAQAQAWKLPPPGAATYTAPSTPDDLLIQQRIAKADEMMQRLYQSLQSSAASTSSDCNTREEGGMQESDFAERLRRADEAFNSALARRDAETGIASTAASDSADKRLHQLIAESDAASFRAS